MKRSLPQHTYRRLEYSVRTMYSTSVCLLLSYYYPWSKVFLFLSPMISILATVMYFGSWQENTIKVLYSSLIGSSIGTIIGFTYRIKALQIILLFVAMVSINRIKCWDRTCYVFCGLALMLGALLPLLTTGQITGSQSFYSVLAIIWIPYLITGVTLLACPHPALACLSSKIYVLRICENMNKMILSLMKAFVSMEQIDVHCAEYDILLIEVKTDVTILAELIRHAEYEVIVFYPLKQIVPALHVLHEGLEKMMIELQGMRNGLSKIQNNQTHQQFIKLMNESLGRISNDVINCFSIISSYFDSFVLLGVASAVEEDGNNNNNNSNSNSYAHSTCDDGEDLLKNSSGVSPTISDCCDDRDHSFKDYHLSDTTTAAPDNNNLIEMRTHAVNTDVEVGFDAVHTGVVDADDTGDDLKQNARSIFGPNPNPANDFMHQSIQLMHSKNEMMCRYQEGRRKLVVFTADDDDDDVDDHVSFGGGVGSVNEDDGKIQDKVEAGRTAAVAATFPPSSSSSLPRKHFPLDPALRHQLSEETALLGIGNFGPRSAFIEKLIMLLELLSAMSKMFECVECEWLIVDFMKRMLMHVCEFILSCVTEMVKEYYIFMQLFDSRTVDRWSKFIRHILDMLDDASTNSIKISSAVTICASLKIFHLLPNLYSGGVWTTLVIVLIREDNASSSFLRAYQRLEGTVVGAIYSFAVYEVFSCNKGNCQIYQIYPAIMLCVGLSCLFREGPRHGYAAVVAAFTPIVLLDQKDVTIGLEGTFGRIQETFLGIAVYLFIDNVILPSRMYPILKAAVLSSILETQCAFTEIVSTIDTVLMYEGSTAATTGAVAVVAGDHSFHDTSISSKSSTAIFKISHDHLQLVCDHTKSLATSISTQESSLRLVAFEPELWYRTVPTIAYEKLRQRFSAILQSTQTLTSGLRSFCSILQQMEENKESISEQLDLYSFMIKDLFSISKQALVSLNLSYEALQRVYIDRDYSVDLDPIILLRQSSYALMQSCNRKFLHDYLQHTQNIRSKVNPYLNMSWQNLFECSLDMVHNLARLGMELHCIRNVEALQSTNTMTIK